MVLKGVKSAMSEAINPKRQCCFCGEVISGEKPLGITLDLGDGSTQDLWSHAACLSSRLHHTVPFLTPDEPNEY
jgi:hypothetical protein